MRGRLGKTAGGAVSAVRTLTVLPAPGRDSPRIAAALAWFPLVGALLGLLYAITGRAFLFLAPGWTLGAATVVFAVSVFLTRGLHLDGLADCADGLAGGTDSASALRIMKDPRVGVFGVLAIAVVLSMRLAAVGRLAAAGTLRVLVPVCAVSRLAMVVLAVWLPYARREEGTAFPFVTEARKADLVHAFLCGILVVSIFGGVTGLLLLLSGMMTSVLLGWWFNLRLGGVTGDVLGAVCEIVEVVLLMLAAARIVPPAGGG